MLQGHRNTMDNLRRKALGAEVEILDPRDPASDSGGDELLMRALCSDKSNGRCTSRATSVVTGLQTSTPLHSLRAFRSPLPGASSLAVPRGSVVPSCRA